MGWQRSTTLGGLLLALVALAAWQAHEYTHECDLTREAVSGSADSVMSALVGGLRSHRRLGPFFTQQIQGLLDGLARAEDVLAVAVASLDGQSVLSAGDVSLVDLVPPFSLGGHWESTGFKLVHPFQLPLETGGPGWGRRRQFEQEQEAPSVVFGPGQTVVAVLVVSRDRADQACGHAAWLRGSIVAAGWLVVICVALAWRATVRLAEARGRERNLEIEARHLRELSQAAAGLAHETRNPLGLIRGWTQRLAESGDDSSDACRHARAVMEECDRVTARINQFLAFARPCQPRPERFDPAQVIEELASLLEPDLSAKQVALNRIPPGTTIQADREMFRQALFNLLQNAVQASPENATVQTGAVRRRDGSLRIEVLDRGPGVPADAVDKLFTPYFTTRAGGAGLGLAIVRGIAAAHGWEVGYSPRADGGAVFWLEGIHG